jgi:ubiquinone/menaquinone biosynthesis C-methylase UbiE
MRLLLRGFFYLLYHPLAGLYDLVAALVSGGRWKQWIALVLPYVEGTRVLELGHGPGHLQKMLSEQGFQPFGVDASRSMGRLARRNAGKTASLVQARAQALPFPEASFPCVVATFPTEYILHPDTLSEARRVLQTGGKFIVLPGVAFRPASWSWKWLRRLWEVTGQTAQFPMPAGALDWEVLRLPQGPVEVILWIGTKRE